MNKLSKHVTIPSHPTLLPLWWDLQSHVSFGFNRLTRPKTNSFETSNGAEIAVICRSRTVLTWTELKTDQGTLKVSQNREVPIDGKAKRRNKTRKFVATSAPITHALLLAIVDAFGDPKKPFLHRMKWCGPDGEQIVQLRSYTLLVVCFATFLPFMDVLHFSSVVSRKIHPQGKDFSVGSSNVGHRIFDGFIAFGEFAPFLLWCPCFPLHPLQSLPSQSPSACEERTFGLYVSRDSCWVPR